MPKHYGQIRIKKHGIYGKEIIQNAKNADFNNKPSFDNPGDFGLYSCVSAPSEYPSNRISETTNNSPSAITRIVNRIKSALGSERKQEIEDLTFKKTGHFHPTLSTHLSEKSCDSPSSSTKNIHNFEIPLNSSLSSTEGKVSSLELKATGGSLSTSSTKVSNKPVVQRESNNNFVEPSSKSYVEKQTDKVEEVEPEDSKSTYFSFNSLTNLLLKTASSTETKGSTESIQTAVSESPADDILDNNIRKKLEFLEGEISMGAVLAADVFRRTKTLQDKLDEEIRNRRMLKGQFLKEQNKSLYARKENLTGCSERLKVNIEIRRWKMFLRHKKERKFTFFKKNLDSEEMKDLQKLGAVGHKLDECDIKLWQLDKRFSWQLREDREVDETVSKLLTHENPVSENESSYVECDRKFKECFPDFETQLSIGLETMEESKNDKCHTNNQLENHFESLKQPNYLLKPMKEAELETRISDLEKEEEELDSSTKRLERLKKYKEKLLKKLKRSVSRLELEELENIKNLAIVDNEVGKIYDETDDEKDDKTSAEITWKSEDNREPSCSHTDSHNSDTECEIMRWLFEREARTKQTRASSKESSTLPSDTQSVVSISEATIQECNQSLQESNQSLQKSNQSLQKSNRLSGVATSSADLSTFYAQPHTKKSIMEAFKEKRKSSKTISITKNNQRLLHVPKSRIELNEMVKDDRGGVYERLLVNMVTEKLKMSYIKKGVERLCESIEGLDGLDKDVELLRKLKVKLGKFWRYQNDGRLEDWKTRRFDKHARDVIQKSRTEFPKRAEQVLRNCYGILYFIKLLELKSVEELEFLYAGVKSDVNKIKKKKRDLVKRLFNAIQMSRRFVGIIGSIDAYRDDLARKIDFFIRGTIT